MKSTSATKLVLSTTASVHALILKHAHAKRLDPSEAAEDLIRIGLRALRSQANAAEDGLHAQIEAEIDLFETVDGIVGSMPADFPDDVTDRVFRILQSEHLPVYGRAVGSDPYARGNPEKARINRRIGRRVKTLLGAEVVTHPDGKPYQVFLPTTETSLITAYTALKPGSAHAAAAA